MKEVKTMKKLNEELFKISEGYLAETMGAFGCSLSDAIYADDETIDAVGLMWKYYRDAKNIALQTAEFFDKMVEKLDTIEEQNNTLKRMLIDVKSGLKESGAL